jgi:hypothetical protein
MAVMNQSVDYGKGKEANDSNTGGSRLGNFMGRSSSVGGGL